MIKLGIPVLARHDGCSRLSVPLEMDNEPSSLWVEVESKYEHALCLDRLDGAVVALLNYAMRHHQDICFSAPITNLLKEQIEKDFLDVLCQQQPDVYKVKLIGPTIAPIYKQSTVRAMGLSCGVDCLYTVHNRMLSDTDGERYFLMTDAHLRSKSDSDEMAERRFKPLYENGKEFADRLGVPLVVVRTNWGERALKGLDIHKCTTFCNACVALSLQNLITHYYIASGGPVVDFSTRYLADGFFETDCSNYDLITLPAISTPSLRFIVDGLERRLSKISVLLDWPECWDNLDVCEMHRRRDRGNDTYDCHKCMHTVCEILSVGGIAGLQKFGKVFDVDYVKAHRSQYLAYLICQRLERSECGLEAWTKQFRRECRFIDYPCAVYWIVRKVVRKIIRQNNVVQKWIDI